MAGLLVLSTKSLTFHHIKIFGAHLFRWTCQHTSIYFHTPIGSKRSPCAWAFCNGNGFPHIFSHSRIEKKKKKLTRSMICEWFKKVVTMLSVSSLSTYLSTGLKRFIPLHYVKIPMWHQIKFQPGTWFPWLHSIMHCEMGKRRGFLFVFYKN